jgi:hypothetical protein
VLTPEQRVMRARIAAHKLHEQVQDPSAHTAPARAKFLERFALQVDPDGVLSESERAKRAEHAKRAYMLGLALKSSKARGRRKVRPSSDGGDGHAA